MDEQDQAGAGRALGSSYRLQRVLGEGAMGQVWLAVDRHGREYAAKVLHPSLANDRGIRQRFVLESSVVTGIHDDHVVQVADMVAEGGTLAVVMELVHGPDLRKYLRQRGTLSPERALFLTQQMALGLAALHRNGIIHRDLKPANVLLEPGSPPTAKLTDFGVSYVVEPGSDHRTAVIGTPQYMAPELVDGRNPTPACDLYALGMVLYELLCGTTPFAGRTMIGVLDAQVHDLPGRPDGIPDAVWALVADLLAKNPAARPASASDVVRRIDEIGPRTAGLPALAPLLSPPPTRPVRGEATVMSPPPADDTVLAGVYGAPRAADGAPGGATTAGATPAVTTSTGGGAGSAGGDPAGSTSTLVMSQTQPSGTRRRGAVVPMTAALALAALVGGGAWLLHDRGGSATPAGNAGQTIATSPTGPASTASSPASVTATAAATATATTTGAAASPTTTVTVTPSPSATTSATTSASSATPTGTAAPSTYSNARFGYSVPIPKRWLQTAESENGDGGTFASTDGTSVLRTYGSNGGLPTRGGTVASCLAAGVTQARQEGSTVTYSTRGSRWYVVSGTTSSGSIYYRKVWLGSGSSNSFDLVYPASQKSTMDSVVNSTGSGFRTGNLAVAH